MGTQVAEGPEKEERARLTADLAQMTLGSGAEPGGHVGVLGSFGGLGVPSWMEKLAGSSGSGTECQGGGHLGWGGIS